MWYIAARSASNVYARVSYQVVHVKDSLDTIQTASHWTMLGSGRFLPDHKCMLVLAPPKERYCCSAVMSAMQSALHDKTEVEKKSPWFVCHFSSAGDNNFLFALLTCAVGSLWAMK